MTHMIVCEVLGKQQSAMSATEQVGAPWEGGDKTSAVFPESDVCRAEAGSPQPDTVNCNVCTLFVKGAMRD